MSEYSKIRKLKRDGFTLIEVLVTVTVFVLVITAAVGILISGARGERKAYQLKEIEDSSRHATELISREIRMAEIDSEEKDTANYEIDFIDSSAVPVNICRADLNGKCDENGDYLAKKNKSEEPSSNHLITSDDVRVDNLVFDVNNFDLTSGPQPRVIILMTLESASDPSASIDLQTTVSPRIY